MSTKISSLVNHVLPEVPGANFVAIEKALMDAAREFCARTYAWEERTTATIRTGRNVAPIRMVEDFEACEIVAWESDQTSIAPMLYRGSEIFVDEDVTVDTTYSLTLAVKPLRGATELPEWLVSLHIDAIAAHAKHALMMLPEKTWTNPVRALTLYQIFTDAVNDAKRTRNIGRLRGRMRMRVPGVR